MLTSDTSPQETYFITDFDEQVACWPEPVALAYPGGEVFVTFFQRPGAIEAKWQGYITAGDVVTASKVYLLLLEKCGCPKVYNDKTEISGDWQQANDWLEFEWTPRAVKAGLRCMAHVYSDNMFSRLSARDLYMRLIPNLHIANFNDRETGWEWLKSCDVTQQPASLL